MTPEPYPTPWRWVDLGLPSGTLWLDRNVGADSPENAGLYFMWGQKFGHTVDSGYSFDAEAYAREGLTNIQSELTTDNDGASIYYGNRYRMPSLEQIQELIESTTAFDRSGYVELISNVNGNSLKIPTSGYIQGSTTVSTLTKRFSCRSYLSTDYCYMYSESNEDQHIVDTLRRRFGVPIRPVKA